MASYFSFGTIRKYIVTMLDGFNNIKTQKVVDGVVYENKVPITWGTKERLNYQIDEAYVANKRNFQMKLPRMALTLDTIAYDETRKINRLAKDIIKLNDINVTQFPPVPYTFSFSLHIITKTLDDYFQIIEQILPYYNPVRNVNINEIPGQIESTSTKIEIGDVSFEPDIDYDENGDQRLVKSTIGFTLYGNIYMPVRANNDIIYKIFVKYYPSLKADQTKFEEFLIQRADLDLDGELNEVADAVKID